MSLMWREMLLVLIGIVALQGCSGGGGNGGAQSSKQGVRLVHGVIESAPAVLFSSVTPGEALQTAAFGEASGRTKLPAGETAFTITEVGNTAQILATAGGTLEKSGKYSVLYYGDTQGLGVHANLLADGVADLGKQEAAIRIVHAAVGALHLRATFSTTELSAGTEFGSASPYAVVTPGTGTLTIQRVTDGFQVFSGAVTLAAGTAYSFVAAGEIGYLVVTRQVVD
jgi:hypothetical protein